MIAGIFIGAALATALWMWLDHDDRRRPEPCELVPLLAQCEPLPTVTVLGPRPPLFDQMTEPEEDHRG